MTDTPIIWRVNRSPRFSALELGEYMAADDGQRETIRRNLKYERMAPSILYRDLHQAVASFLASPTRDRGILARCREGLELAKQNAATPQKRDNATYALRSLDVFERSLNALPVTGINIERAPIYRPHEIIPGVKVSIQPTALVRVVRPRGGQLRGAIIVDVAKGIEPKSPELKQRVTNAMLHTAMLLHEHVSNTVVVEGEKSSPDHCMTFHTHRQELVRSPATYRKQLRIMQATCRTVKAVWATIDPPSSFDAKFAKYRE